jgi:hypothetical protein
VRLILKHTEKKPGLRGQEHSHFAMSEYGLGEAWQEEENNSLCSSSRPDTAFHRICSLHSGAPSRGCVELPLKLRWCGL